MKMDILYLHLYGWNDSLQNISNYKELCIKYHLLSFFFSIEFVVIQQKVSCFQIVKIIYLQYIQVLSFLRMQRLHISLLYVGHVCIIKRHSFLHTVVSTRDIFSFILPVETCTSSRFAILLS